MKDEPRLPDDYESLVIKACDILASGERDSLETLWALGEHAAAVDDHDPKAVDRFAADIDLSRQDVILSMQLRRGFPSSRDVQWIKRKCTAYCSSNAGLVRLRRLLVHTYPLARDERGIQDRLRQAGGKKLSWLWKRKPPLAAYMVGSMHRSSGAPRGLIRGLFW